MRMLLLPLIASSIDSLQSRSPEPGSQSGFKCMDRLAGIPIGVRKVLAAFTLQVIHWLQLGIVDRPRYPKIFVLRNSGSTALASLKQEGPYEIIERAQVRMSRIVD